MGMIDIPESIEIKKLRLENSGTRVSPDAEGLI
jgi:hypothetical protein